MFWECPQNLSESYLLLAEEYGMGFCGLGTHLLNFIHKNLSTLWFNKLYDLIENPIIQMIYVSILEINIKSFLIFFYDFMFYPFNLSL